MTPFPIIQPTQQFPEPFGAQYLALHQPFSTLDASARTAYGQDVRAEPCHGLPLQDAMQLQQPASDRSSSDQATPASTPTTSSQGSQVPHQEQSYSVPQSQSPIAFNGDSLPQQFLPDTNVYHNMQLRPARFDAANSPPIFTPYDPYQPVMNDTHGLPMSTFTQSPNPNTRYQEDPAHPMTLAQRIQSERLGYQYPETRDPYPMISAAGPSAELDALTSSQNCLCGPGCDCVYCAAHPYNAATRGRVQEISQIMATENYWSLNHVSQPQTGHGDTFINGTNTELAMGQGYLPQFGHEGAFINGTNTELMMGQGYPPQIEHDGAPINGTNTELETEQGYSPQTGHGGAPIDDTNTELEIGQGCPPLDQESFPSTPYGWTHAPMPGPALQPTSDEGASVDNGDNPDGSSPRTMHSSRYFTVEYRVDSDFANAAGKCMCGDDCKCVGCLTHQGHLQKPT